MRWSHKSARMMVGRTHSRLAVDGDHGVGHAADGKHARLAFDIECVLRAIIR